ncbi:MAG: TonB family protein [Acidobacteriota bacterium]|nr:TonB family protein [Acidobacteriota bacterium]
MPALAQTTTEKAEGEFRKDLELNPAKSLSHFRMGEMLLHQHNLQDAAIEFAKALQGDPQPDWIAAWSRINLGKIFSITGQRERGIREYQKVLQIDDNTFGALDRVRAYILRDPSEDEIFEFRLPSYFDWMTSTRVSRRLDPDYTAEGTLARLEGDVLIAADVTPGGAVAEVRLVRPLGLGLDEAAMQAVRQWQFEPATVRGQRISQTTRLSVHFQLPFHPAGWRTSSVQFSTPQNEIRPVLFAKINDSASARKVDSADFIEAAEIARAMSRSPTVRLSLEIDMSGNPTNVNVEDASAPAWGEAAVREVLKWRFRPGAEKGRSVSVFCQIGLVWHPPE